MERYIFENRLNILNGPKSEEEAIDNLQEYDSLYLRETAKDLFVTIYLILIIAMFRQFSKTMTHWKMHTIMSYCKEHLKLMMNMMFLLA